MGRDDVTVHGFRSSLRDWVEETTSFAGSIAEAALGHVVGDKVAASYRRGDLFEKRRKLHGSVGDVLHHTGRGREGLSHRSGQPARGRTARGSSARAHPLTQDAGGPTAGITGETVSNLYTLPA